MTTVNVLGSTGSIGVRTLEVARQHKGFFRIEGLAAGKNLDLLKKQIEEFKPRAVYLKDDAAAKALGQMNVSEFKIFGSADGIGSFASYLDSDILVAGMNGTEALHPVLQALQNGKRVALANKEILVAAGSLVVAKLRENPAASLVPIDSEHSAIFQCLQGSAPSSIEKLILTSSGGPLREMLLEKFLHVTKEVVVNHPKWKMGRKISVDSATLMNKGLEIIEASWLFDVPIEQIEVLIHPEAVIHSMVEFCDGSILAQLGVTDMRLPIQYALSYPERLPGDASLRLDFATMESLSFSQPDRKKFPCLDLAFEAAKRSGSAPCVLSAADEIAVEAYLQDKIRFVEIPQIIENVLTHHRTIVNPGLAEIESTHLWATEETRRLCRL
jgi:1-deoxy-D-xylulose-5-phosphate reductoisomerase